VARSKKGIYFLNGNVLNMLAEASMFGYKVADRPIDLNLKLLIGELLEKSKEGL